MLRIRDRRAAALAALLAVLGVASTAMGLQTEATTLPPVAADDQANKKQDDQANQKQSAGSRPDDDRTTGSEPQPSANDALAGTNGRKGANNSGGSRDQPDDPGDSLPAPPLRKAEPRPATGLKRSEPTRLKIPAIGLDAPITPLGLREDGTLEVPPLRAGAPAAWYDGSPTPGETGASVVTGHVDSAREGPAVFYRLRELRLGDTVDVRRKDGSAVRFKVYRVATYPKHEFPGGEVYGPTDRSELRLITCGGSFDRKRGSYRDNVVVYARG